LRLDVLLGDGSYKLLQADGGCAECPRRLEDFVQPSLRDSEVLFVFRAPKARDVQRGELLASKEGTFFKNLLQEAGVESYSATTLVHCRPPEDKPPTDKEMRCCLSQYVSKEVKGYRYVVLVGGDVLKAFYPTEQYKTMRGNFAYHPDFPGTKFYTIYDPEYIIQNGHKLPAYKELLVRLAREMAFTGVEFETLERQDFPEGQFLEEIRSVFANSVLSLDIETNSLKPWAKSAKIKSVAFCADEHKAYFSHDEDPLWDEVMEMVKDYISDPQKAVIGHNVGFDLDWLERDLDTVCEATVLDTQTLYYLWVDRKTNRQGYKMASLKQLTASELDGYRHMVVNPHLEEDLHLLKVYNGEDVIRTLQLFRKAFYCLPEKTRNLYLEVASYTNLSLRRMSSEGAEFDLEAWLEAQRFIEARIAQVKADWQEQYPEFDPDKHLGDIGLRKYLFDIRKYPVINTTENGAPSTDKYALQAIIRASKKDTSDLKFLLELRKLDKLNDTYIKGYKKHIDEEDGKIHASYTNSKTDTQRTSSFSPNVQQIPRPPREDEKDKYPVIRSLFYVPSDYVFYHADYSQIEVRVAMSLANDKTALEAYKQGMDAHQITAEAIVGGKRELIKEDRTRAKAINFALCVPMDTQCLTKEGFKSYEQLRVGDYTLAYEGDKMVWSRILRKMKYKNEKVVKISNAYWSARTTPNHRWYGDKRVDRGTHREVQEMVFTTEEMGRDHRIHLSKPLSDSVESSLPISPDEAAIIGWLYSDGCVNWSPVSNGPSTAGGKRRGLVARIFQKKVEFVEDITALLDRAGYTYTTGKDKNNCVWFHIASSEARELLRRADLEFGTLDAAVLKMDHTQLHSFMDSIKKAEGSKYFDYRVIAQNAGEVSDAIELAGFMLGHFVRKTVRKQTYDTPHTHHKLTLSAKSTVGGTRIKTTELEDQDVWCVQTEHGSWAMKQDEQIMVTGNCFGGSPYTLQNYARDEFGLDFSEEESEEYHSTFFATYHGLAEFHRWHLRDFRQNEGWVTNVVGFTHYYPKWNHFEKYVREHNERASLNMRVQGPAAQITLYTLKYIQKGLLDRGLRSRSILSVHDSIISKVARGEEDVVLEVHTEATEKAALWTREWLKTPLVLDYDIGTRWSDIKNQGSISTSIHLSETV
jgi:uracil-DNA glycosylase family 4